MSAGASGGHKRALNPLKLEFQVGTRWPKWALEPNPHLFQHRKVFTTEPFLQPRIHLF